MSEAGLNPEAGVGVTHMVGYGECASATRQVGGGDGAP